MIENIVFTLTLINQDFFISFGIYTLIYLLVSIFNKNDKICFVDEQSTKFISFVGVLYFLSFFAGIFIELNILTGEEKAFMFKRMFGHYWFGFWTQPITYLLITQLLRIIRIRKNSLIRILFSLFLIFSIERMVITSTSFHRDYLPSSWSMNNDSGLYPSNIILALLLKVLVFLLFVGLFYKISTNIKKWNFKDIFKNK